jgi:hypothetical protein
MASSQNVLNRTKSKEALAAEASTEKPKDPSKVINVISQPCPRNQRSALLSGLRFGLVAASVSVLSPNAKNIPRARV